MAEPDISTVPKLAKRAKADGIPISEYTIRRLIKTGERGLISEMKWITLHINMQLDMIFSALRRQQEGKAQQTAQEKECAESYISPWTKQKHCTRYSAVIGSRGKNKKAARMGGLQRRTVKRRYLEYKTR